MPDYVPALRGQMGDWVYYVTPMKLAKVAKETKFISNIHKNEELDELMQREIGERVKKEMVPYLLHQPQRFYGALIVAVYGGEPEFSQVNIAEHELINDSEKSSYGFGLLRFDGSQMYFALDGQHRLKSIQLAIEQNPDLGKEEVVVIIVKHDKTQEGLARTRRLFSTLNRRAEPTKVGLNIAIDEDDPVAITTRRLVKEHTYLGNLKMVKANKEGLNSKRLSTLPKDETYLTTLQTLYECNDYLLQAYAGGMDVDNQFKSYRPSADDLDAYYDFLADIWTDILETCPDLSPILQKHKKPGALRIDKRLGGGGSVIARPIGQLVITEFLSSALRQKAKIDGLEMAQWWDLVKKVQREVLQELFQQVSTNLDEVPWVKLVWNPASRDIVGGKKERRLIVNLLLDLFTLKSSVGRRQLLKDYRELTQDKKMKLLSSDKLEDSSSDGDNGGADHSTTD